METQPQKVLLLLPSLLPFKSLLRPISKPTSTSHFHYSILLRHFQVGPPNRQSNCSRLRNEQYFSFPAWWGIGSFCSDVFRTELTSSIDTPAAGAPVSWQTIFWTLLLWQLAQWPNQAVVYAVFPVDIERTIGGNVRHVTLTPPNFKTI